MWGVVCRCRNPIAGVQSLSLHLLVVCDLGQEYDLSKPSFSHV